MKTENEIEKQLKEIDSSAALGCPPATTFENATLALKQMSLEAARDTLKWVLEQEATQ